jgi:Family of unknown function (DUF6286)
VRVFLRVLAPLLGLVLAVAGLALVVETVTAWVAPSSSPLVVPWAAWRSALEGLTWQSGTLRVVAIVVGVVGLLVLLVGLVARRHDVYLADPVPEVTVTTSPRSLARAVGHEVRSHDDVLSASVVASATKVTVKASTLDPADEVRATLKTRVEETLANLPLARRPRVAVSVTTTKGVK